MGTQNIVGSEASEIRYVDFSNVVLQPLLLDGTGSEEMAVDGSVTPKKFYWTSPPGFDFLIHRMNLTMIDNLAMTADEFAGLGGALANGVQVVSITAAGDIVRNALPDLVITRNGEFALLAGIDVANSAGTRGLFVRWTVSRATGGLPVRLPSGVGAGIIINDNLTSLTTFKASVQGIRIPAV